MHGVSEPEVEVGKINRDENRGPPRRGFAHETPIERVRARQHPQRFGQSVTL